MKSWKSVFWHRKAVAIALVLLVFMGGCEKATPLGESATIRRVISGNSLEVILSNQNPPQAQTVRLMGINAPLLKQEPWGQGAKDYLAALLPPQTPVILETDLEVRDRYNRLFAYIWLDSQLIDETLLKQGWGLVPGNTKYQTRLDRAQAYARIMGYGIWNPENPLRQAPSAFQAQEQVADP